MGTNPILSSKGFRYYISFIDAYSKFTWLYLIKCKLGVRNVFKAFKTHVERQLNQKIFALQADNGKEFTVFESYLQSCG